MLTTANLYKSFNAWSTKKSMHSVAQKTTTTNAATNNVATAISDATKTMRMQQKYNNKCIQQHQ